MWLASVQKPVDASTYAAVPSAATSARESLTATRHGWFARTMPTSRRKLPRITAVEKRIVLSSRTCAVPSGDASSCRRSRTLSRPSVVSSALPPTKAPMTLSAASRSRPPTSIAPSAGTEIKATPSVALATAVRGPAVGAQWDVGKADDQVPAVIEHQAPRVAHELGDPCLGVLRFALAEFETPVDLREAALEIVAAGRPRFARRDRSCGSAWRPTRRARDPAADCAVAGDSPATASVRASCRRTG